MTTEAEGSQREQRLALAQYIETGNLLIERHGASVFVTLEDRDLFDALVAAVREAPGSAYQPTALS